MAFDAVSGEDVMAEFDAIETAKKVQREQVMEEITLPAWGERYYNHLVKNVHAGKNTLFLDWHEKTDIENIVIVIYNDNTRNKKGGLYGDKN